MRTSINMICRYVVDDYKCSCWCVLLGISFFHLALNSLDLCFNFFFSSRRRHTRFKCDWSSDVCSSDLLGLGRGLARREFAAFRMSMDESRERFDEAAPMIVNALKTGFIEGDGKHYKQPRTEIRPRPLHSFDGRIYAVASSEESVDSAAKLGAHMVMFADRPWEMRAPVIERGRRLHRRYHGTEAPQVMLTEFCIFRTNLAETEAEARQYQGKFVESNFYHYEFLGEHFKTVKGYDAYQQKAEIARKGGIEGAVAGFMQAASGGTRDKILRELEQRRKIIW